MDVTINGKAVGGKNKVDSFFLIFGLVWFLFAIPFGIAGYYMIVNENLYQTSAKKTKGTLISKSISESRDSKSKNVSRSYNVKYKFTNEQGLEVSGDDSVSQEYWDKLEEGKYIDLEYIPGRSDEKNRADDGSKDGSIAGYIFIGFATLMEILGLAFLIPYFKKKARHKRLNREGTMIEGEITSVGPGSITINGVRQWQLRYSYKDHMGKLHEGKSEHMPPHQAQPWNKGDKCKIRYDKNKPAVNIFVGK